MSSERFCVAKTQSVKSTSETPSAPASQIGRRCRASSASRPLPEGTVTCLDYCGLIAVKHHFLWLAGSLLLAFACLGLGFRHIDETLPYPQHIDEPAISNPAVRTLTTGTFHPYEFNYPSLPKYLASLGMAVGFLKSAAMPDGVHELAKIGRVGFPFYDVPEVMQGARRLFALLAAVALFATGACAFYASRRASAWVLAPLFLALSPLFFSDSWSYLTVDTVGLAFVALTLAFCLHATWQPSLVRSALLPGACAGLAAASKYTLAVVVVSVLAGILL